MRTAETSAIDKTVGGRIRARRAFQRVSQEDLGGAIGVTFQQIQKYEDGRNRVAASVLVLIARKLAVPVSYFFDEIPAGDTDFAEVNLSPQAIKLAQRFDEVRDPYLRQVMERTLNAFEKMPARDLEPVQ